jgi:hypothetical protein
MGPQQGAEVRVSLCEFWYLGLKSALVGVAVQVKK